MSPAPLEPARLFVGLLRLVSPRDVANATIGDQLDELAERTHAGRGPLWPGLWLNTHVLLAVIAAIVTAAPRAFRSTWLTLRGAIRTLQRSPASSLFIMLVLAIGIAAATVTFSVVDAVVLRPLPFDRPEQLVSISSRDDKFKMRITPVDVGALRAQLKTLEHLAPYSGQTLVEITVGTVFTDQIKEVGAAFFEILGLTPQIGRLWTTDDENRGEGDVAVISHALWRDKFNSDPNVIGLPVVVSERSTTYRVIGVLAPSGDVPNLTGSPVFVPKNMKGENIPFGLLGRMRTGVTPPDVADEIQRALASPDWRPKVTPLLQLYATRERSWMLLALGAAGLVVLIACVNAANMMLTRSAERSQEMAIRASLGASRRQIAMSVLAEGLVLSFGATAAALLVSFWGVRIARSAVETMLLGVFRASSIALNGRILVASIAAAVVTGVLFSLVPAWQTSRASIVSLLKDAGPTVAGGRGRWRSAFLIGEVATVCVLLVVSWLFVTSLVRVVGVDLGVDDRSRLLAVSSNTEFNGTVDDVQRRIEQVPGVTGVSVSLGASMPLIGRAFGGAWSTTSLTRADAAEATQIETLQYRVTPNYFDVAGVRFRQGGTWAGHDPASIVLDEVAARQLFGNESPIGRRVSAKQPAGVFTVVGTVAHTYARGAEDPDTPSAYFSLKPNPTRKFAGLFVRTSKPAADLQALVTDALTPFAPTNRAPFVHLADEAVKRITAQRRFNAWLMLSFGIVGILIAAAGIYAVMASVVIQQTREIGVRMALGASPGDVQRGVLLIAARHLLIGLAIGLPGGWFVSRGFAALFFRVTPADLSVYAGVAGLLAIVGVVAVLVPARRASRVDPIVCLRA